ncbi:MAG: hypothetical protein MRZ79_04110 [Bacteroidia bacterium]|nr:hypothetical protein [Bacteroidia bacterium]
MKKLLVISLFFICFSLTTKSASGQSILKAFQVIEYTESAYDFGKTLLEDIGWAWWDKEGILSLTTDRKNGVTVLVNDEKLAEVFPHKHANYKVKEGNYVLKAYDNKNPKKVWIESFKIEDDGITELTLSKDGWTKRSRKMKKK